MISAIVLAAGASSRMGTSKATLMLAGRPLLSYVLQVVQQAHVDQIVLVLGADADAARRRFPIVGITPVVNPDFAGGVSTSIRVGVRHLDQDAAAFFVVLGDQPFVSPFTLDRLAAEWRTTPAKILVPSFRGQRGSPVLLDRSMVQEVDRLTGDEGFRSFFAAHPRDVRDVPVEDPGVVFDIDTPDQVRIAERVLLHGERLASFVLH